MTSQTSVGFTQIITYITWKLSLVKILLHLFKWRWWLSAIWANKIDYWIFCEMLSFHGPIMNLKVSRHPVISISLFHENIWISKSHFRLFTHRIRSSKEHELREISKILFSWLEPVISCPCCLVDYVMSHVKISLNSRKYAV